MGAAVVTCGAVAGGGTGCEAEPVTVGMLMATEGDAALDQIPAKFVNAGLSGMRCDGDRCSALSGKVGVATSCGIYAVRPEVCRTCMPGDVECGMARKRHGLPALA